MKKLLLLVTLLALSIDIQAQGSTWNTATLVKDGETVSGTLNENNTEAWFKIEVAKEGNVTFDVKSDANLVVRYISINVMNAQGTECLEKNYIYLYDEEKPYVEYGLKPGTYYIRLVRQDKAGKYTMKYTYTAPTYQNDSEPNDEWKQAQKLENGQTVQGHLGYWEFDSNTIDEKDWYRIEVPDNGSVTFDVHSENTLTIRYISLYPLNDDGVNVYERSYIYLYDEEKPFTINNVAPGTYYVLLNREVGRDAGVNKHYGGYTIKYTFTPNRYRGDVEPNDTYDKAIEIKDGETKTGHLGYLYNTSYTDDDDWYKVDVQAGFVRFEIHEDLNTSLDVRYIELYKDDNGTLRSQNYVYIHRGERNSELTVTNLDEGIYYLKVHREKGEGGYALTCGSPQRSQDSKIRVNYIGKNSTRLGIPSPFQIKIENLDSHDSGSFFLIIPASDDVDLLYAECPCDTGVVRYTIEDMRFEDNHCAGFIVPNLKPFESYTFTMYAEGHVDKNARSNRALLSGTLIAVGAYVGSIAVSMVTDKVTEYLLKKAEKRLMPEEKLDDYGRIYSLTKDQYIKDGEQYNMKVHAVTTVAKKCGENVMKAVPGGAPVATTMGVVETIYESFNSFRRWFFYSFSRAKHQQDFQDWLDDKPSTLDAKAGANQIVSSWDPNEMCGPAGFGDKGYISETKTMDYRILFENKKEATAPAYRIRISDVLDENVFDVNSVRFGTTSHEGAQYNWKMSREGNKLSWDIEGIELPPNVNAPEGEGYVTFSVDLKPGLKSGTAIKNKATIIFDYNAPIETNEYLNTLDTNAPTGNVESVTLNNNQLTVRCSGEDAESGVSFYKYYYSVADGDFQLLTESDWPEVDVPIEQGRKASDYSFCVVAVDNVGNTQLTLSDPRNVTTAISKLEAEPNNDTWSITNLNGLVVASGKGTLSAPLAKGAYIIRQGNTARKIILK